MTACGLETGLETKTNLQDYNTKTAIQSLRSVRIVSVRERRGNEKLPKCLVRSSSIIHAELNFLYLSMTYGRLFL